MRRGGCFAREEKTMLAKTIRVRVEIPAEVAPETKDEAERSAHEAAVLSLWQAASLSTRQAAEELGLSYHDFLDLLAARGLPVEQGEFDMAALETARRKLAGPQP
jgi:predicted DNA-binding protein (UPF0251 family)